jgi:hypothetical protein
MLGLASCGIAVKMCDYVTRLSFGKTASVLQGVIQVLVAMSISPSPPFVARSSLRDSSSRQRLAEEMQDVAISQNVLLFLIAFRVINALSIKTFFQPDEYFQSLEPAWQIAFGKNSGAWITWVGKLCHKCLRMAPLTYAL